MRDLWRIRDEILELMAGFSDNYKLVTPYWWMKYDGLKAALDLIDAAITERECLSLSAAGYSE